MVKREKDMCKKLIGLLMAASFVLPFATGCSEENSNEPSGEVTVYEDALQAPAYEEISDTQKYTSYYFDSENGDDKNDGLSETAPKRTVSAANALIKGVEEETRANAFQGGHGVRRRTENRFFPRRGRNAASDRRVRADGRKRIREIYRRALLRGNFGQQRARGGLGNAVENRAPRHLRVHFRSGRNEKHRAQKQLYSRRKFLVGRSFGGALPRRSALRNGGGFRRMLGVAVRVSEFGHLFHREHGYVPGGELV